MMIVARFHNHAGNGIGNNCEWACEKVVPGEMTRDLNYFVPFSARFLMRKVAGRGARALVMLSFVRNSQAASL